MLEDMENRLRIKGRATEGIHFGYQNDAFAIMHTTVENIMHLYMTLNKGTQIEILPYIARIMGTEVRNEQSLIMQQSLILSELTAWHCYASVERIGKGKAQPAMGKGKLWLLNE